jgi:hypothetical protein
MLTAAESNLVAGGIAPSNMKTLKIKVLRPFYWRGKVQAEGSVIDYPEMDAREVLSMKKAELVVEPAAKAKEAK